MKPSRWLALPMGALALCGALASAQDSGSTSYTRDAQGRIETVATAEGVTRYSYYPDGEIRSVDHPDGSREAYDHDEILSARRLIARLQAQAGGQAARRRDVHFNTPATFANPLDQSRNRFAFTGYYFDSETGLYYARARYYDPSIGRFITADSNLGSIDDPPSLNRFVYAHDRPTSLVDPTGHETASAGCYWGPSSCGEHVPLTNVEKRAAGGLVGALRWGGKALWGTLNLAMGRHWDGFGENVVQAAQDPTKAIVETKEQAKKYVNTELDAAQDSIERGDHFGAGSRFSERVAAPAAAAVVGAGEMTVGVVRTGTRLLAGEAALPPKLKSTAPALEDASVAESSATTKPFVATEEGQMRPASGGSQGADALDAQGTRAANKSWSRSGAFSNDPVTWKATRPKGTGQSYEVFQRADIEWDRVRTSGDKRFIGKTNAEAAKAGLAPQLSDERFATLHHVGQNAQGPLVEAATDYHGAGRSGQQALHSQFGPNQPHPEYPVNRQQFAVDTREYWQQRVPQNNQ